MSEEKKELAAAPANPLALIQTALDKGMTVDNLGKLLDLQERWERNRAKESYALALNECQAELPVVVKDAENAHTRSRYATLPNINHAIKPVYTKHGFSLTFSEGDTAKENNMRVVCDIHHSGGHSETKWIDVPLDGKGVKGNANMTDTQGKGSTFAYGCRYLTCRIFNVVVADEDLDGNAPTATLNDKQIELLDKLITECESYGALTVRSRFLKWLQVDSVEDIAQSRYIDARDNLVKSVAKAKKDRDAAEGIQ